VTVLADEPLDAPLALLPLEQLRAQRAALREELVRARRWERLVQARLDLAADALDPAGELAGPVCTTMLRGVVGRPAGVDPGGGLSATVAARSQLRGYTARLSARLEQVTDQLVARYTADPASCLGALTA